MSIYLGFDTSNYTTSVAAVGDGNIVNIRKILEVGQGKRGIRQSDAVFIHMKELPNLFDKLSKEVDFNKVGAIGVSTRPRNAEGSYMPVFLAGEGYARVVSKSLGVPLYEFSHQDGHIMAGVISSGNTELLEKPFLSVHLSGGTTEILKSRYKNGRFENEIVGGTKDISAGQLIDRVGVMLGFDFPCGRKMEQSAMKTDKSYSVKLAVDGGYVNLSGAETFITRGISGYSKEENARTVFVYIAKVLSAMLNNVIKTEKTEDVLIVGGVASNLIIREILDKNVCAGLHYASPEYSTDNGVGIAALAERIVG